jgi:hypothetical protein
VTKTETVIKRPQFRAPTLMDELRLLAVQKLIEVQLWLVPKKTNDGILFVCHIHSLMAHFIKHTPVESLDWDHAGETKESK